MHVYRMHVMLGNTGGEDDSHVLDHTQNDNSSSRAWCDARCPVKRQVCFSMFSFFFLQNISERFWVFLGRHEAG